MVKFEFVQSDLGAAAYLLSQGRRLLGLEQIGPNRYGFRFDDSDGLAEKECAMYFGGALCCALNFGKSIRSLKDQMYAQKTLERGNGKYEHTN